MKTICLSLILLISCIAPAFADQLARINQEQAERAVSYLKERKVREVILWGACDNTKVLLKLDMVSFRYVGQENYYEVMLSGTTSDGKEYSRGVDLANVYLKSGKKAECLGLLLGYNCNPCSTGFEWPVK